MKVKITCGKESQSCDVPFSIGDIVTVHSYGSRFCAQVKAYEISSFYKGDKLNLGDFSNINFDTLDKYYSKMEWRVLDIGTLGIPSLPTIFLAIRLVGRAKEELLVQYNINKPNKCLNVVRKGKKQYNEYIINL